MATVEITRSNKWGIGAIFALIVIIFLLLMAVGSTDSSKDGEMQKLSTAVTNAVDKMSLQNKTIDDIDGAVKKIPGQLREVIIEHEDRMHSKKPDVVSCCLPTKKKVKPIRKLPEVQKPQPVDKVAIVSSALQDCNSFGGVLILREGKIVCDIKNTETLLVVGKVAQPTPLQEGVECDAGNGRHGVLKIVDGVSRCVWEEVKASPTRAVGYSEQARFSAPPPRSYPPEQRYYPPVQQAESSSGSWVPWAIAAAVTGVILYKNNRRATTLPPVALSGGPVNPAPLGGPINPVP